MSKNRKHFTNLYGEPVDGSKFTKFTSGPEFTISATLAACALLLSPENNGIVYTAILTAGAAGRKYFDDKEQKENLSKSFSTSHTKLVIDKKPDENSTPTKPEHLAAAIKERQRNIAEATAAVLVPATMIAASFAASSFMSSSPPPEPRAKLPPEAEALLGIAVMGMAAHAYSFIFMRPVKKIQAALRFDKVVKGEWVITDRPPPEKATESLKDKLTRAAQGLLPKPGMARVNGSAMVTAPEERTVDIG